MKKGLSVLLIAAALFGFYGGAVNLNDVLACKDYWEEEGERSTADMNKLEDGLNQLKDNEQAYLDGLDAVADGEDALAQGEADYAAGQATLAKGEADYAAAPAKLAAGRSKLQKGEASLAEAVAKRADLKKVKNKIEKVEPAYKPWLNKFNKLRTSIVDNPSNPSKGVLYDAGAVAVGLVGDDSHEGVLQAFGKIKASAVEAQANMDQIVAGVKATLPEGTTDEQVIDALTNELNPYHSAIPAVYVQKYASAENARDELNKAYSNLMSSYAPRLGAIAQSIGGKVEKIKGAEYQATELRKTNFAEDMDSAINLMNELAADSNIATVKGIATKLEKTDMINLIDGGIAQIKAFANASKSSKSDYDTNYDELKPNAPMGNKIGSKVAAAAKAILSNDDIKGAMTGKQISALKPYMQSGAITGLPNIELLYGTMTLGADKKDDGKNSLLDSLKALQSGAAGGVKKYNEGISDGENQLASGRAEYRKGLADYKAAPGKLAAGRAALAEGLQKLMDGRKELAAGKDKLAEYEDGEQQVRDGLATLMGTEANGGLESILDRRSGDDDFDNGDKHLDLDEGLDAVDVGRGYQADSGELITKEITNRAIGTAAGLGAGALAVLAAILSFLKKNKGSGVCALLSAAAGGAGIAAGTSAGTEFSSIAGSAVGATPWIAFGILAAVAAVHAIAHFASKEA